jgi:glycosyltransferase involved in cell wall biosynthesis
MTRLGHCVSVMTTTANGKHELPVNTDRPILIEGVEVRRYPRLTRDNSNFTPGLLLELWRSVRQYDVIHIQSWWNLVVMPAALICLLRGVRPVISPRGSLTAYTFRHSRRGLKWALHTFGARWLLSRSLIHVTSERERLDVQEAVPGARSHVLPNILDLPKIQFLARASTNELHILHLGRIDPKKRLDFLIRVLRGLSTVQWKLSIVGDGDSCYIDFLKTSGGDDPRITWHGPVYGSEKWQLYAGADLFALPSYNENYGNVIIEALSQGTPVLMSSQVGIADWVTLNSLGWVADLDEGAWRDAITRISGLTAERERIRRDGPACVSRDFDPQVLAKRYIDMYAKHLSET